jgi:ascorbate-specific PTS system EIIC-type component UlaA
MVESTIGVVTGAVKTVIGWMMQSMPAGMEVVEAAVAPNPLMPKRSDVAVFNSISLDSPVWVVDDLMVGGS